VDDSNDNDDDDDDDIVDAGLLSGDAGKTLVAVKSSSCSSSTDSPLSHHLSTADTPPSVQHHLSAASSSQHLDHSNAVTSHYEDLTCLATDWLPSDADAVTWATVTESGAHLSLAQSGGAFFFCSLLLQCQISSAHIWITLLISQKLLALLFRDSRASDLQKCVSPS